MNKVYKKVWNKLRGCYVAVSEALGTRQGRGRSAAILVTAVALTASGRALAIYGPVPDGLVVEDQQIAYSERDYDLL